MKIAIVGSREPGNINFAKELEKRINIQSGDTIISGGAKGIDSLAAEYATAHGLALVEIRPNYAKNGRGATFIRNREIVDNADMVVAFWNVPGGTLQRNQKKAFATLKIAFVGIPSKTFPLCRASRKANKVIRFHKSRRISQMCACSLMLP